ncbi:MAG: acetylgalactosaminidase, partial [Saprospiraceae bacterium]|nr:acetylgalactosaminidase [Saprospiraceae bacterium]
MNTSIIRTHRGRTIMLQHDISSPRPNVRFSLISGTKGTFNQYTSTAQISTSHGGWKSTEEFNELIRQHAPPLIQKFGEKVENASQISKGRSYERVSAADWRFIDCLRNGLPVEMDVYDAALWSSVTPLSEWSVAQKGASVKVPDFTSGAWKTNKRGMDILIVKGGSTNLI